MNNLMMIFITIISDDRLIMNIFNELLDDTLITNNSQTII